MKLVSAGILLAEQFVALLNFAISLAFYRIESSALIAQTFSFDFSPI